MKGGERKNTGAGRVGTHTAAPAPPRPPHPHTPSAGLLRQPSRSSAIGHPTAASVTCSRTCTPASLAPALWNQVLRDSCGGLGELPERRPATSRIQKVGHSCAHPATAPERGHSVLRLEDSPEGRDERRRGATSPPGSGLTPRVLRGWAG